MKSNLQAILAIVLLTGVGYVWLWGISYTPLNFDHECKIVKRHDDTLHLPPIDSVEFADPATLKTDNQQPHNFVSRPFCDGQCIDVLLDGRFDVIGRVEENSSKWASDIKILTSQDPHFDYLETPGTYRFNLVKTDSCLKFLTDLSANQSSRDADKVVKCVTITKNNHFKHTLTVVKEPFLKSDKFGKDGLYKKSFLIFNHPPYGIMNYTPSLLIIQNGPTVEFENIEYSNPSGPQQVPCINWRERDQRLRQIIAQTTKSTPSRSPAP